MQRILLIAGVLCGVVWLVAAGGSPAGPWYIQTVDATGSGDWRYTSLALGVSGYPHIAYRETTSYNLRYARWTGSAWAIQTVDSGGDVGSYPSLALDGSGYGHISYRDSSSGELKYAAWDGTRWDIQAVDSAGDAGGYTSLALDPSGYPHISYYTWTSAVLKYAAWNGSDWNIETVDSAGDVGRYSSLALDASGYPHISYYQNYEWNDGDLKYAAWDGSAWATDTVDTTGYVGQHTSLALDASGYPHIAYYDRTNEDLKYAAWNGSGWDIQSVDTGGSVGEDTSLVLDGGGHPHISYYDEGNGDLKYASWNGSSWDIETVDSRDWVGSWSSLALDGSGYAHISYDSGWPDGELTYATSRPALILSHNLPTTGYYMISAPLMLLGGTTVHDLLCDDVGHDRGDWYVWPWSEGTQGYEPAVTPPACLAVTPDADTGVWLLAQAGLIDMEGAVPTGDQEIPLGTGWNIIGPLYDATMDSLQVDNGGDVRSLEAAQAAGWVLATFYYSHDGTGSYNTLSINQTPPDELSLWYGYWVLAGVECSLIVPEPSGPTAASRSADSASATPAWAFEVRGSSGSSADSITVAAADSGSDDFDGFALDRPKPPAAPGEGRLRVVLREGWRGTEPPPYNKAPGGQMPWSSELAMETKSAAQGATEWEFTVAGGVGGETVALTWPQLSRLPKDRVAILTDQDTGKRTFMRTRAQYEFAAPGEQSSRSFTVAVKSAQEGALLISGLTAMPTRAGAWDIGFNLSADAAVTARIYNVAGRRVADIAESRQLVGGRASLSWNGRSTTGTAVPSGAYLMRLTARTQEGEQASAVAVLQVRR